MQETTENYYVTAGNHKTITLIGTDQIPTRIFTIEQLWKLVRVQANIRRFLAQQRLRRILENPELYINGERDSDYQSQQYSDYYNVIVAQKLEELLEFDWNDEYSQKLLQREGLGVVKKPEKLIHDNIKYTGEWSGTIRHGRGT